MRLKRNMKHPNFIVAIASYILFVTGIILNASSFDFGRIMIVCAVLLGGIHWLGSIVDVWTDPELKHEEDSKAFWLGLVIMIPPLAGMLYYLMNNKKISM